MRFAVPARGHYELSVYDVSGRRVRRLASGIAGGGTHETVWDGRDGAGVRVAAGTYVVRLEANGRVDTRKVVVLRRSR